MSLKEKNAVVIRIWTSSKNKIAPGDNVGHVSLGIGENESTYVSFWPTSEAKDSHNWAPGLFKPIDSENKMDYVADFQAEGRAPEFTYKLYSLDTISMKERFNEVISKTQGWSLVGSNLLINQGSGHSCASMAYEVLKAGGIYDLLSSRFSSNLSSAPSPDALARAVIEAKKVELVEYPETQKFDQTGCTPLPAENPKTGLRCQIM